MADWNRVLRKLSVVLPAGAFGASVLLALAASEASAASNSNPQINTPTAPERSISARLQTIRAGVSDLTGSASFDPEDDAKATPVWWGNGGWGNGGWGNGGWHNGGWGNVGWGNGGWHNGWHNFWHNW